jgi:D-lactate dehydrogenase (cytochrome)
MRENVLNLTAVLADGSVVKTANRARKSASGYDLTHLLIGTEGTLGVITELTLRLFGVPEVVRAATCQFGALEGACNAVIQAIQLGLGVARIELLDEAQIHAINFHSKLTLPEAPTLILEFHGNELSTRNAVEQFQEISSSEGAIGYQWAESEHDRRRLWKARHDAYFAVKSTWPGKDTLVTDVCVPISRLAQCVVETQADIKAHGLTAPIVGHVGDGNFHCCVVFDPKTPSEREAVELFLERLSKRALAMDGTCTGEHGVGQGKVPYMVPEHGVRGVQLMRQIKDAMDPKNILNPGKIFPAKGQN